MERFDSPLENIRIASPCSADWNDMAGNERRRHCGECKLNVYNLSGMTRYDAENLLRVSEGSLCVRYYRSDGTILTADCPVGWAKVKQRLSICTAAAFSILFALISGLMTVSVIRKHSDFVRRLPIPFSTPTPEPLMGAIALPSPTPKVSDKKRELPVIPAGRFAE